MKNDKKLLLIVTGGIASYKALDFLSLCSKKNIEVDIILTETAKKFVTELSFNSLNSKNIYDNLFDNKIKNSIDHIELSRKNNLILIYPATANFISKIKEGRADDLASATILASNIPIFVAPAMNCEMLENKATKENLEILEKRNIKILNSEFGKLACGEIGEGKLQSPENTLKRIEEFFFILREVKW